MKPIKDDHHVQAYAVNLLKTLWSKPYVTWADGRTRFTDVIMDERSWHTAGHFHTDNDNWDYVVINIVEELYPGMTEQMREEVWYRARDIALSIEKSMVFRVDEINGVSDLNQWFIAKNLRAWYVAQLEANRYVALAMLYTYE